MAFFRNLFGRPEAASDLTMQILGGHLDGDFMTYPLGEGGVAREQVSAIGDRFGVRYPAEFAAHVCGRLPGAYVTVLESVWPRPELHQVGPFWTFLYAVHSFTPLSTSEDWMRLDVAAERFQAQSGLPFAPILKVEGDADLYCVDEGGAIFRYDHELNETTAIGLDFWELFEREIAELVGRKDRFVREGLANS